MKNVKTSKTNKSYAPKTQLGSRIPFSKFFKFKTLLKLRTPWSNNGK